MAAMVRLLEQTDPTVEEVYRRKNEAEEARQREYLSSVKIQAWYRGERSRAYIKHLNKCATIIQKIWRGFIGRGLTRILIKNSVLIMKINYYNKKATYIQKMWRGYYVRKYVFNYYSRKRYLEALQIKNEIVRSELEEYSEMQEQERRRKAEKEQKERREQLARKNHYLISTEVIPGVFNSPFLPYPTDTEYLLRSVRPLMHEKKKKTDKPFDPTCKSYDLPRPRVLPPLSSKPQGPFRDPSDVQQQRYKPFQPSLRVATSFTSLEEARQKMKDQEWVTRLNDNVFEPFSRREVKYDPLLHTRSRYGHLPYGFRYFREEFQDKHISSQSFKTLVPPIPIFDKLNDTYSQGQVF
ncbi:spermatogenesis-associated protein 17-like [Saccostrea echinata]|uniref:spermatogenesis-associated protein 17-like n=1 Tax=Saccostrea echinata TaxID=191078 RepID=UPI002A8366A0|nr:spermatogenesis-associated protein 17-like [Saccostrea echinata]